MKNLIASAILTAFTSSTKAQDIIVKIDSSKLETTVLEIPPTQISYKYYHYSNEPKVSIAKKDIAYIIFSNGVVENFNSSSGVKQSKSNKNLGYYDLSLLEPNAKPSDELEKYYRYKNYLGFNHIAFLNNSFGISYMRDIKQLNLIPHISIAIGYDKPVLINCLWCWLFNIMCIIIFFVGLMLASDRAKNNNTTLC